MILKSYSLDDVIGYVNGKPVKMVCGGSEPATEVPVQGQPDPVVTDTRAPYADYLEKAPEGVRPLIEPIFKEWDAGVTKRFQDVHSQYEPYKELVDTYEPEGLQQAVQIAQAIEADPTAFLNALAQSLGVSIGEQGVEGQQPVEPQYDSTTPTDPRLDQHEQLLQVMAENMLQQRQAEQAAAEDAALDSMLEQLHSQHGDFDDTFVLNAIAGGLDPTDAVETFNRTIEAFAAKAVAPSEQSPVVVGAAGSGYPTQQTDLSKLDAKGRKDLVAQMLKAAAEQQ